MERSKSLKQWLKGEGLLVYGIILGGLLSFITCNHARAQSDSSILVRNTLVSEYQLGYSPYTGVQTIYYCEKDGGMVNMIIWTRTRVQDAVKYLQDHFELVGTRWLSYDKKYQVTITNSDTFLMLIKQRIYEN